MNHSIDELFFRGLDSLGDGKLNRAKNILDRMTSVDPNHPRTIELAGDYARECGELERAIDTYQRLCTDDQSLDVQATGHLNLGSAYFVQKDLDQAVYHYRQAAFLFERAGEMPDAWQARIAVGEVLQNASRFTESVDVFANVYEQIKAHRRRRRYADLAVSSRRQWAESLRFLGQLDEAALHLEKALALGKRYKCLLENITVMDALGVIRQVQGRFEEAKELHLAALAVNREIGSIEGQSVNLGNLAQLHMHLKDWDQAESYAKQTLQFDRQAEDLNGIGFSNLILADIDLERGNYSDAERRLLQVQNIFRQEGKADDTIIIASHLGVVYRKQGRLEEAEAKQMEVLKLAQEMNHLDGMASTYDELGEIRKAQGRLAEAKEYWEKSLAYFEQLNSTQRIQELKDNLASLGL